MSSPKPDHNSETPPTATAYSTPPALIAFTLAVVVVCFVGFSIVYFCRCYFVSIIHTWAFQRSASAGTTLVRLSPDASSSPFRGLDPSLLQAFPTFLYASVKDLRKEKKKKYSLECAICLLEFEDDSMLRLLTVCCHVFHQECIDLWLRSHKTCPVCRKDLDSPTNEDNLGVEEESRDEVCVDVKEGEGDQGHDDEAVSMCTSLQQQGEQRFARSHFTGHSIVLIRGGDDEGKDDDDKYTLRLPEHVAVKIVRGGHNYTKSWSSYKEVMMTRPAATCSNCGYVQTVFGCSSRSGNENI